MKLPVLARISVIALWVSTGCALAPVAPPASTVAPPTPPPTATVLPTSTTVPATQTPVTPQPTPEPTEYEQAPPPNLEIVLEDGERVPAFQGSWCFDLGCLDSIPPEKADLPLVNAPGGESIVAEIDASARIGYWQASYGQDTDSSALIKIDEGGTYVDPDAEPVDEPQEITSFAFVPAPVGDWVLVINVQFAGGRGDGSYFWHVIVPEHGTRPPAGTLAADGEPVPGQAGTYCYGDTCADMFRWPHKDTLPRLVVGDTAETMEFSVADELVLSEWSAWYSPRSNDDNETNLARSFDPDAPEPTTSGGSTHLTLPIPPSGDWAVFVSLYFTDSGGGGAGDLSYAWHVIVD